MKIPTILHSPAPGVHVWSPGGGWGFANCVLVADGDRGALIDTPYTTALAHGLRAAAGPALPRIETIVNTHANGDHCFTNHMFGGPGTVIVSTQAGRDHAHAEPTPQDMNALVVQSPPGDARLAGYLKRHFGVFDFGDMPRPAPPTRTVVTEDRIHAGGIPVHLIAAPPAHSAGDLIVHLPEQRVVASGDIVFAGDHPVHWAGPLDNVMAACRRILDLDPEWIVPGHGPLMRPDGLRAHLDYLQHLRDRIHAAYADGESAEEAAASVLTDIRQAYPDLGLPERTVVITHVEYAHLAGAPATDILTLLARAAALEPDPVG